MQFPLSAISGEAAGVSWDLPDLAHCGMLEVNNYFRY